MGEDFLSNLTFGAIAGVIGASTVFPMDLAKTRLQNQGRSMASLAYTGVADVFKKTVAREGLRGLYRGLSANLVGIIPEKSIKLACNDFFRAFYSDLHMGKDWEKRGLKMPLSLELLAGASAGLCQVVATNPMEITKIRLQMQSTLPEAVPRMNGMQVVQQLGIRGLYQGTASTLLRDIPFSALYFASYARLKMLFTKPDGELPFHRVLTAALVSGAFAAAVSTPPDVIKTRLQTDSSGRYRGIMDCFRAIVREDGYRALWKGLVPRVLIISPLFGITLLVYELQKTFMGVSTTQSVSVASSDDACLMPKH